MALVEQARGAKLHSRLESRTATIGVIGLGYVGLPLAAVAVAARVPARAIWQRARVVLPLVLFVALFRPKKRPEAGGGAASPSAAG